jgi:methyl-accepting chemotaxis protein
MLGNLRISYKLLIMIGVSVLGIAVVAGVGLSALWNNLLEDRKAKLRDLVLVARTAVDLNYQASRQAGLSEAETLERGKTLLRTFRFGREDYFYAFNAQGVVQVNPNQKIEGKNLYDTPDSDGVFFIREQIALAASGGGFLRYRFSRPGNGDEALPKMSYAAEFKPYGWVIGGGIYLDDVYAIFRAQALQVGMLVGLALLLVAGVFLLLSRSIVNPINAMTAAMRKIAGGETSAVIPALERREDGNRGRQGVGFGGAVERTSGDIARRHRSLPRQYPRRLIESAAISLVVLIWNRERT